MERKTIIVVMAANQPHFESSKKNDVKNLGFSLSIISCEQGAM